LTIVWKSDSGSPPIPSPAVSRVFQTFALRGSRVNSILFWNNVYSSKQASISEPVLLLWLHRSLCSPCGGTCEHVQSTDVHQRIDKHHETHVGGSSRPGIFARSELAMDLLRSVQQ